MRAAGSTSSSSDSSPTLRLLNAKRYAPRVLSFFSFNFSANARTNKSLSFLPNTLLEILRNLTRSIDYIFSPLSFIMLRIFQVLLKHLQYLTISMSITCTTYTLMSYNSFDVCLLQGEGVPTSSSSSKKRKHTSQGQQGLQSPIKTEANGHHMEQEPQKHQQLPAMHLQSVPVASGNSHGSSLLQQALQSAQIPDNNPQPPHHHSTAVSSSRPINSINSINPINSINSMNSMNSVNSINSINSLSSEPPPDPAPASHHYVTSHHLTLPIMTAESKPDGMVRSICIFSRYLICLFSARSLFCVICVVTCTSVDGHLRDFRILTVRHCRN